MATCQNPRTYTANIEKRKFKKFEGEVRPQSTTFRSPVRKMTNPMNIQNQKRSVQH